MIDGGQQVSIVWRVVVLAVSCCCVSHVGESCLAQECLGEPRELFNGKDLDGWYTYMRSTKHADPQGVFQVVAGQLRISGEGFGYLATRETFQDYELRLEYRWGDGEEESRRGKARDSGVFLHARGPDGNSEDAAGAFMAAIECQVMEGATGDFLLIRGTDEHGESIHPRVTTRVAAVRDADQWPWHDPDGMELGLSRWGRINWRDKDEAWEDRRGFRGARDVENPVGEWNELCCRCEAEKIEIRLNGELVNEAHRVWPSSGKILLQCEGAEIFYRNIRLYSLDRPAE